MMDLVVSRSFEGVGPPSMAPGGGSSASRPSPIRGNEFCARNALVARCVGSREPTGARTVREPGRAARG